MLNKKNEQDFLFSLFIPKPPPSTLFILPVIVHDFKKMNVYVFQFLSHAHACQRILE